MTLAKIVAHPVLNLDNLLNGRDLIALAPAPIGTYPFTILSAETDHARVSEEAIREAIRTGQLDSFSFSPFPPFRYRIHRLDHAGAEPIVVDMPEIAGRYSFIALLGEEWLLVRARTSNDELNADVYDTSGRLLRSFRAGDCIHHIQATTDGTKIWMGYGDEGIFGGTEYGREGVMEFRSSGDPLFRLHSDGDLNAFGLTSITSCYAMNVTANGDVWFYYLENGYSLIQVRDERIERAWRELPVRASRAFAITKTHAIFAGNFEDNETLYGLSLNTGKVKAYLPVTPDGDPIVFDRYRSIGRGPLLYTFQGSQLFVVTLPE